MLQVSVGVKPPTVVNAFINQVLGRFGTNRNVGNIAQKEKKWIFNSPIVRKVLIRDLNGSTYGNWI